MSARQWALLAACFAAGCSSGGRQIVALPPRPTAPPVQAPAAPPRAPLAVGLLGDGAPLPEEVAEVRFVVGEIGLWGAQAGWVWFPVGAAVARPAPQERAARELAVVQAPPGRYDSLAVTIRDVFVRFGETSGGPIGYAPAGRPLPIQLDVAAEPAPRLLVQLSNARLVVRADSCRWRLNPEWAQASR